MSDMAPEGEDGVKVDTKDVKVDAKPSEKPAEKLRSRRQRGTKKEKPKPETKIVIRRLPPTMTEEEFLKQIDPLPEHDYYYFAPADWSLGLGATCRAYLTMKNFHDVFLFRDRFDGYVFVDSRGAEYAAVVEFAPFQGLPKSKSRRNDNKVNTIEQEPHYQQFLAKLEEERECVAKGRLPEMKLDFYPDRKKEAVKSTPLLQYIASKKEKRREESRKRVEEKKRQREEDKEKRRQMQPTQVQKQPVKLLTSNESVKKDSPETVKVKTDEVPHEDAKNSRSKRRAERGQRRREEHEQRKKEKERLERENKDKVSADKPKERNARTAKKSCEEKTQENKDRSDDARQRKDGKRGDRRDRNRGRRDKEKDKVAASDAATDINKKPKTGTKVVAAHSNDSVSETVKDFIRSATAFKETLPINKKLEETENQTLREERAEVPVGKEVVPNDIAKTELEKKDCSAVNTENKSVSEEQKSASEEQKQTEGTSARGEKRLEKQRSMEDRRIRNKDRPSIAIYQPKARMRLSEESDTAGAAKDAGRSNPTSDCESVKKEEQCKKVTRYSEQRKERRAQREKQKSNSDEGNGNANRESRTRRVQKSKSFEVKEPIKDKKTEPETHSDNAEK